MMQEEVDRMAMTLFRQAHEFFTESGCRVKRIELNHHSHGAETIGDIEILFGHDEFGDFLYKADLDSASLSGGCPKSVDMDTFPMDTEQVLGVDT